MMLASFKYNELSVTVAMTDHLIRKAYELFLATCTDDPFKF